MKRNALILMVGIVVGSGALVLRAHRAEATSPAEVVNGSIAFFEARLAGDPINGPYTAALADRYLVRFGTAARLEDLARAESLARAVLPLTRDSAPALTRLSGVLLARHAFAEAASAAKLALAADSGYEGAVAAWLDASLAMGRYEDAGGALVRLTPGMVAYELRRVHLLDARGESRLAMEGMARVCTQLERRNAIAQARAWCLAELGGMTLGAHGRRAARRVYERALDVLPGYRGAEEGLAHLDVAEGRLREAQRRYERIAVDAHPDLYLRLADVSRALGAPADAERWERRFAHAVEAPGAEALYAPDIAMWLADRADTRDRALAVALGDVARRPTVQAWDVLSWVQWRRGDLAAAFVASDSARRWGVPSPTMDAHRGLILLDMGRESEARPLLHAAAARPELLEPHVRELVRRFHRE